MRHMLIIAALCSLPLSVQAQTPTGSQKVSWVAPAQFIDNTEILSTTVLTYNVYAKLGGAAEVKLKSALAGTSFTLTGQPVGQNNCYAITALTNGASESARSPQACGVVLSPTSKSVTTVVIQ